MGRRRCDETDSCPLRGLGATGGDTGPPTIVGAEGNRLETGKGEGRRRGDGGDDKRHGGGGNNGADGSGGNDGGIRHGIGRGEGVGGVTGSQWLQLGGVERGGDGVKRQTKLSTTGDTRDYIPNVAN